ncbi:helix-turn-helix domain-containing protein [Schinkia azotoformans]|uniref:helix-turn-helix domain-containing protein n=1 Tax=Schinkia azotoformans TaxID=1454 RepID=UPI002DBB8311|nr:helix-turn-helix transcriptional regulator [Schinkia azotoformans]MEC1759875.1 helix-turn-helix transcriptional regulator [Schinkia azotoformans]
MNKSEDHPNELDDGLSDDFGRLIKEYRLKKGYSLAQLEDLARVSPSYVSRIERGLRSQVSFPKVLRICFTLGIPYELMISKAFGEINQSEVENENPTLEDILYHQDFTIYGKPVDLDAKEILVSTINLIFGCTWDSKTKIHDLYQVSKKIERLKDLI